MRYISLDNVGKILIVHHARITLGDPAWELSLKNVCAPTSFRFKTSLSVWLNIPLYFPSMTGQHGTASSNDLVRSLSRPSSIAPTNTYSPFQLYLRLQSPLCIRGIFQGGHRGTQSTIHLLTRVWHISYLSGLCSLRFLRCCYGISTLWGWMNGVHSLPL